MKNANVFFGVKMKCNGPDRCKDVSTLDILTFNKIDYACTLLDTQVKRYFDESSNSK